MASSLFLTGDINLMGVTDPAVPLALVTEHLRDADLVFANLECCFFAQPPERAVSSEGFYAAPETCAALGQAGIVVVGNANNVNYGAPAIRASLDCLDRHGIAFTGAGRNEAEAQRPVVIERAGIRFGFLQRTSVFWSHGHRAEATVPGVAALPGHTAYRPKLNDLRTLTRPGNVPEVITWADPEALQEHARQIRALKQSCDFVVASHHWGLDAEVLDYQREIAHNAIDAGADVVFGHGPHVTLPIEFYHGRPIFYGAGSFSFETGHMARRHPDWLGLMVELELDGSALGASHFRFVRHNAQNETIWRTPAEETTDLTRLAEASASLGCRLVAAGERVTVMPAQPAGQT